MSSRIEHVAVLIPACNEEELLPRCLRSVIASCLLLPVAVTFDILVAVDSSTDQTLHIGDQCLKAYGTTLVTEAGSVGVARALAASNALARYRGDPRGCWLANTDADCVVPPGWLVDQMRLAESGVDAIAGTVALDEVSALNSLLLSRFHLSYEIYPDGTHPHVHGANLGMRAEAYLCAGGWSTLCTAEDHEMWQQLARTGAKRRSVAALQVLTSGRSVGRAPNGFAGALAAHMEAVA